VTVSNELWLVRTISVSSGTRVAEFREAVRQRDWKCVITRRPAVNAEFGNWRGFEAAHIFPLAYEGYWVEKEYGRWITIPPGTGGSINSVQNGLLLTADIHILFDSYDISINPDVSYIFVYFSGGFLTWNLRIITRLFASVGIVMVLPGHMLSLEMMREDQLLSFYVGISDRRYWLI